MFELFNEPRNWKWMLPAAFAVLCVWWWNDWFMAGEPWRDLAIIPLCLGAILGLSALINISLYIYHHWSLMYSDVQAARTNTPEVRMFEAAKGMHPEAVKALLVHRRSIWRIRYVPLKDVVDWIFDEIPTVHAGFVDFVLDHSTAISVMPKRLLSDGSRQFDSDELVTDYQQYDDLIQFMQVKLMLTQAFGNQAPQWIPPWNPELVRHRFGLDGAPYAVEEEGISDAMQAVLRAQSQWKGNGLKDLGSTQQSAVSGQQSAVSGQQSAISGQQSAVSDQRSASHRADPDLTDQQLDEINNENMAYAKLLKGDSK